MPFPSALSAGDYSRIRAGIYNAERYLVVFTGTVQMQFSPTANASGKSNSIITYSTVDSGGTSNVIINMTVLITPTTDYIDDLQTQPENCLITYVRQAPTSTKFYVGDTAFQWTTSSIVTVLDDWRVHEKRTLVSGSTIYKNATITRQNPRPRIYDLYDDVVVTSAPSVAYSPTPSAVAMTSGGSISSWSWDTVINGTVSKVASTSQNPTFTLALGTHWLVLTATDNGGLTHTLAVKVAVVPRNFDSVITNAIVETIQYNLNDGASAGISKLDSAATILPGSPCLVFDHLDYTNGITEDNLMISGWLGGEVQLQLQGSDEWGQLQSYGNSIKTVRQFAENIRLPAFPVREKTTPSVWGDMTRTGIYDAIWYIVSEHSTVANVSAQAFPSDYVNYRFPSFNTPGGTLPDVLDSLAFRASGDMLTYAPHGEMVYAKSLFYETNSSNRDSATVYGSFTINDGQNFVSQRSAPGIFGMSIVICGHATFNTTTKAPRAYSSQAPAGFVPTVLLEELDGIIMSADLSDANAIAQAGKFTANHFFAGTESIDVDADLIAGYLAFPRVDAWIKLTLDTTDTLDGSSFDTTNDRFIVTQLASQWNRDEYYIINSVTVRRETDGGDNYANETNFLPIGTIQNVPTYPIQNGYPDLSDYEDMSDYYGTDYDSYRTGYEDNSLPPEDAAGDGVPDAQAIETLYVPFTGGAVNSSFTSTLGTDNYRIKVSGDARINGSDTTTVYDFSVDDYEPDVFTQQIGSYDAGGGRWRGADSSNNNYLWLRYNTSGYVTFVEVVYLLDNATLPTGNKITVPSFTTITPLTLGSQDTATLNDGNYSGAVEIRAFSTTQRLTFPGAEIYVYSIEIGEAAVRGDAFYWKYNYSDAVAYDAGDGLNLDGSGIVHAESYHSDHVYELTIDGTGNPLTFSFTDPDGDYSDNENKFMKVEIFAV